ncbi:enoyl-CoA hydratase/isomerase family protein [Rhodococcus erythropolis]|uniref:enoyl-CoA hydratase/isomerase family protein n=1 Tax=Rhodococcus erythropolis TaxID=1833 RepID=UPI002226DE84|nr:enoyl-CoA hydratase-related protein [Rhodococcus erythropolis]MCW2295462.1 2-(1,2-epoxy-1,2-dihydrophenyl)acetyl-CoA isomerase [Rhodococcus erythropolis]
MTEKLNERVIWSSADGIARITLAGGRGNALNSALAEGFAAAVNRVVTGVRDGTVRVVVIAAEGSAFSVGGDLNEFVAAEDRGEKVRDVAGKLHDAILILTDIPVPVVSMVQGIAAGGGVGIALAADLVFMAAEANIRLAYTAAGLTPDCGSTWVLPRQLGLARALDLALTNRALTGTEAAEWGLISRAVPKDELSDVVEGLVTALARGPVGAFTETKRMMRSARERTFGEQLADETATIGRLIGDPDGVEGVDAFLAKRPPEFR